MRLAGRSSGLPRIIETVRRFNLATVFSTGHEHDRIQSLRKLAVRKQIDDPNAQNNLADGSEPCQKQCCTDKSNTAPLPSKGSSEHLFQRPDKVPLFNRVLFKKAS
uniref:Uncharacterized protein n=1 Tax=Mycena chlorophos TaxID=658473 RepID=A0ABQ0M5L7_MYCCL|nr:predicted protein [Mycena chlorophos]